MAANIKIRSSDRDSMFLLLALTRLVHSALFPPPLSCDRLFLIFARIYSASSFDPESSLWGSPARCTLLAAAVHRAALFHFAAVSVAAGSSRSTQPRTHACCSSKSCAEQAAQGTATCLSTWSRRQQPFRASRERQCEEQLWYQPAWRLGRSFPSYHVGRQGSGNSQPFSVPEVESFASEKGGLRLWLTQHLLAACKQRLKLRRGFFIQAVCWKHCPSHCRGRLEEEVTLRNTWEGGLQCRECCTHTLLWAAPSPRHSQRAAGRLDAAEAAIPSQRVRPAQRGVERTPKPTQPCPLSIITTLYLCNKQEVMDNVL